MNSSYNQLSFYLFFSLISLRELNRFIVFVQETLPFLQHFFVSGASIFTTNWYDERGVRFRQWSMRLRISSEWMVYKLGLASRSSSRWSFKDLCDPQHIKSSIHSWWSIDSLHQQSSAKFASFQVHQAPIHLVLQIRVFD